ncbi:helix-turn-helix domain-containing protein [Bacillus sp. JJ1764]|uniref:helix-turn-helix domain-containing protein n=1 Tax=Bacillus sp. JJ1764 TaxID=3122964 RepID=UPI002FFDAB2B
MNQCKSVILDCLKRLNNERTVYSIFHLFNGKKSAQTIQDAHLFRLKKYFGIFETITRDEFDSFIQVMKEERLITTCGEQKYLPSQIGEGILESFSGLKFINGWTYQKISSVFWERLSLFVQVASHFAYGETRYIPIQKNKDIQDWLKKVVHQVQVSRHELGTELYSEINSCFEGVGEINPSLMVFRLTGFGQIGLTSLQAAKRVNLDPLDYHLDFLNILHFMIQKISSDLLSFPLLAFLLHGLDQDNDMTQSTRKTWNLLKSGYSIEMIAAERHLKMSTIEDHLVEIALHRDDFSIEDYVHKELQEMIIEQAKRLTTKQLKYIKDQVKIASYFQIRLVLAKYGVQ